MPDHSSQIAANIKQIEELKKTLIDLRNPEELTETLQTLCSDEEPFKHDFKMCKLLAGHFGKIYAMDWGADETTVLSAAQDGSLILWNALTVNKLDVINLRSSWVMSCAMSPSGRLSASGGLDNICTIYKLPEAGESANGELKSHKELHEHTGYLSGAAFLDDSKVISSSGDATCILWDIEANRFINVFQGHTSDVMDVKLLGDTGLFVSGSCDMTCKVWDVRDHKADVMTFPGHDSDINAVDSGADGNYFCSAGDESVIIMHDVRSYGPVQNYTTPNIVASITSVAFSQSNRVIFAGYDDNQVHVWDSLTGSKIRDLESHTNRVSCLGINKQGTALCTGGWDQLLRIWA